MSRYDVIVVGAGVVGAWLARELSRYQLKVLVLEKKADIGGDATLTNSAMICSGYDTPQGSLESLLVAGSRDMYDQMAEELEVPVRKTGALMVALRDEEKPELLKALDRAYANGVYAVELLTPKQALKREPSLNPGLKGALYIPREDVINQFELVIALFENALANGAEVRCGHEVLAVRKEGRAVVGVSTNSGDFQAPYVVNAAALFSDRLAESIGVATYRNYPRKGEFCVLDVNLPYAPKHTIEPIPSPITRGRLIIPTVHGNTLLGPTALNIEDRDDKDTTREGLRQIIEDVRHLIPAVSEKDVIRQFAGLRPAREPGGYHIETFAEAQGYVGISGVLTGISASPALARYVISLLRRDGLPLEIKDDFNPRRRAITKIKELGEAEKAALIEKDPRYGRIVCRCCAVSEGEIVEAINRPLGARSVDAVKRRVWAGAGRCQGGFCLPRIVEILARELRVPAAGIPLKEPGSRLLIEREQEAGL